MLPRFLTTIASVLGASGVLLGAFGAHLLKSRLLASGHLEVWHTAVFYHLIHTLAAFAACAFPASTRGAARSLEAASACWLAGVILFSGSLYSIALGGPVWLGPLTPCGGLFLVAGWLCLLPLARRPHP